jgi:hypothetical protein
MLTGGHTWPCLAHSKQRWPPPKPEVSKQEQRQHSAINLPSWLWQTTMFLSTERRAQRRQLRTVSRSHEHAWTAHLRKNAGRALKGAGGLLGSCLLGSRFLGSRLLLDLPLGFNLLIQSDATTSKRQRSDLPASVCASAWRAWTEPPSSWRRPSSSARPQAGRPSPRASSGCSGDRPPRLPQGRPHRFDPASAGRRRPFRRRPQRPTLLVCSTAH